MKERAGKVVVVTGGSRGLGRGLCDAFLARGAAVAFCARRENDVRAAETEMKAKGATDDVLGAVADVAKYADLANLWSATVARFGRVDVWINNAGASNAQLPFYELPAGDIDAVVGANLAGTMNGVHVALTGMRKQEGGGHVFTMEGFGSDGARQHGMSIYGATKTAIRYFTRSVAEETAGSAVKVGSLSPGIVVTDLLVDVYAKGSPDLWKKKKWLFELIADPVEDVAPWLADRVLAGPAHGEHVAWMTVPKAVLRVFQPKYWRRGLFAGRVAE